jgi:glycosyltransferase involved in cell wall biosynthesis
MVTLLFNDRGKPVDGIRDHTRLLAESLEDRTGAPVSVEERVSARVPAGALGTDADAVVLQYSPFCYGRWGFAPWLPLRLLRVRARRSARPKIVLFVHEPYVPLVGWRGVLMGLWQRLQLEALRLLADAVVVSIQRWAEDLARRKPTRPVRHLPVGSNLPDMRAARAEMRRELRAGDGTLVVALFGRVHPGWQVSHAEAAIRALRDAGHEVVVLSLGAEAPPLSGLDGVPVHAPGELPAPELARHFAAADVFLAPFVDGVSTRRTTLMSALQHGLPIVGTDGPLTDDQLRAAADALALAPADGPAGFAELASAVAGDDRRRREMARAARELYESTFDWAVSADAFAKAVDLPQGARR